MLIVLMVGKKQTFEVLRPVLVPTRALTHAVLPPLCLATLFYMYLHSVRTFYEDMRLIASSSVFLRVFTSIRCITFFFGTTTRTAS